MQRRTYTKVGSLAVYGDVLDGSLSKIGDGGECQYATDQGSEMAA